MGHVHNYKMRFFTQLTQKSIITNPYKRKTLFASEALIKAVDFSNSYKLNNYVS